MEGLTSVGPFVVYKAGGMLAWIQVWYNRSIIIHLEKEEPMTNLTCHWLDCTDKPEAKGYCALHRIRALRSGWVDEPWIEWNKTHVITDICIWEDCDSLKFNKRGLCSKHNARSQALGHPTEPWVIWKEENPYAEEALPEGQKRCSKCKEVKPCEDFQFNASRPDKRAHDCAVCKNKFSSRYRRENPEVVMMHTLSHNMRKRDSFVEHVSKQVLRDRDGDDCYLCQEPLQFDVPRKVHLEHKTPLVRGGEHSYANCALSCQRCNNRKKDKTVEEYLDWLAERVAA